MTKLRFVHMQDTFYLVISFTISIGKIFRRQKNAHMRYGHNGRFSLLLFFVLNAPSRAKAY